METPPVVESLNTPHYRIVPSIFPPINFFEKLVPPEQMEAAWLLESLTNDRLREEAGDLGLVPPEDRVSGVNASVVMAAFTHIHKESRFSDGSYGVYYAALDLETSIRETVYHREKFLSATQEDSCELNMRVYRGKLLKPLHDIRSNNDDAYHDPDGWSPSQHLGAQLREEGSWGIFYRSVRHPGGECIAALRPPCVSLPKQGKHLTYIWNGSRIHAVYEKSHYVMI